MTKKKFSWKIFLILIFGYVVPILLLAYSKAIFQGFFAGWIAYAIFIVYFLFFTKYLLNQIHRSK